MQAKDIENYLTQLGQELVNLGVQRSFRVLLIGGAYWLPFMGWERQHSSSQASGLHSWQVRFGQPMSF